MVFKLSRRRLRSIGQSRDGSSLVSVGTSDNRITATGDDRVITNGTDIRVTAGL